MIDWIDLLANSSALFTLSISVYIFFSDPLRRWTFFGFKPTAIAILKDPKTNKVLLIKNKDRKDWYFPQGGIYSTDTNQAVDTILSRELGIPTNTYKFYETRILGTIHRHGREYAQKYNPAGSITLFPKNHGKGYVACYISTDFKKIKKYIRLGNEIEKYKIMDYSKALALIDFEKKKLLQKHF